MHERGSLVNLYLGLLRQGIRGDDAALVKMLPDLLHRNIQGQACKASAK